MRNPGGILIALLACHTYVGPIANPAKLGMPGKSVTIKIADLENFSLKIGGVTFNNFCIHETPTNSGAGQLNYLRVLGCYCNRSSDYLGYSVTVIGLDKDGELLWGGNLFGGAPAGDVGKLSEPQVGVPLGTLKQTASVRIVVRIVNMNAGVVQPCTPLVQPCIPCTPNVQKPPVVAY